MSHAQRAPLGFGAEPSASATSDAALLDRARAGDASAFETLFYRYYEPLWRFTIGYVKGPDVARELVHDLFLHIWERRTTHRVKTSVAAYLYAAARHRALNYLRHERYVARWTEMAARVVNACPAGDATHAADVAMVSHAPRAPDDIVVADEHAAALRTAVATLPERQRQALVLRWFHGLKTPEVAVVLGVSTKAVESLMVRAFASLRGRLTRD